MGGLDSLDIGSITSTIDALEATEHLLLRVAIVGKTEVLMRGIELQSWTQVSLDAIPDKNFEARARATVNYHLIDDFL